MEKLNQIIEIVYDSKKKKLRARCIQDGQWVRFPNNLRKENSIYKAGKMKNANGSHWIASDLTEIFLNQKNQEIEELLGIKNKGILNKFYSVIVSDEKTNKINTEMLNLIFIVKKIIPNMDEQLIEPLIKKYTHSAFISEDLLADAHNLLITYNEKRIVSLFSSYEENDFLEDTVIMYKHLFENDVLINDVLPEKPKNIRELHTVFMRESSKIKQPKLLLNQNLNELDGSIVKNFVIFVPQTSLDLISIGNALGICVGNGYYAKKIMTNKSKVITLKKDNEHKYCIEFDKSGFIQCRGKSNADMEAEIVKALKDVVFVEKPKKSKELEIN